MNSYSEAIKKAEESVKDMKDETLKPIAFETVLKQILSEANSSEQTRSQSHSVQKHKSNDSKPRMDQNIELSAPEMAELKERIQNGGNISSDRGALVIAECLETHGLGTFTKKDIETHYRKLVRAGANLNPVRNYNSLVRDMADKFWFERVGRGKFRISDEGAKICRVIGNAKPVQDSAP